MLLNLDTLAYYVINRTGLALWIEIDTNNASILDDLVGSMCDRFAIDGDVARQKTTALVKAKRAQNPCVA